MPPTTISSWALLIAKALDAYGCRSNELFEQAGLDPRALRDPNARYPIRSMKRLWALSVAQTQDPCFGLAVSRFWHPTTFHALGYAWFASASLMEALLRLVRYFRVVSTGGALDLEDLSEEVRCVLRTTVKYEVLDEVSDAALATLVIMCRMSKGPDFSPSRVEMRRPKPACSEEFSRVFRAPIHYSAAENALYFDGKTLHDSLPTANAELARANDQIVTDYLAQLDRSDIAMRVKAKLLEYLPSGYVSEETVAEALHISLRTLQRKLSEAGTTYKQLLDETRRALAAQYIKNSALSLSDITYLLGFSEPSNFSRAFKRWMGTSPSEYRSSF